jgi:hypothetical protein
MQSQYLITKDENGNYVIANSEDGEKLCGLNCSGDDPCKNCDKCVKPQPVIAPTLMPTLMPDDVPAVPITSNPVMVAKFKRSISTDNQTPKSMFINEEGKLTTLSIVLIVAGVLFVFFVMYFMLKKYKKHRKFKRFHLNKDGDRDGDEPSVSYINDDFDDTNYDSVEDY